MSSLSETNPQRPLLIQWFVNLKLMVPLSIGMMVVGLWLLQQWMPAFLLPSSIPNGLKILGKEILLPYGNLFLLLSLLLSKLWPALESHLETRSQHIRESIVDFESREGEVIERYKAIKEKLAHAHFEVVELKMRSEKSAKEEAAKIVSKAEKKAKALLAESERIASHEGTKATHELQSKLIDLSFAKAEELLKSKLTDQEKRNQETSFLRQFGEMS